MSMNVSKEVRIQAIEHAKELTKDHKSLDQSPHDRLWELANKLNVSKISHGACRSQGFLKRKIDGSFAIYYCADHPKTRRRFTVAHELGHIVLEKYLPHISPENNMVHRGYQRSTSLEKTVDRIASELLMPEFLIKSNIERTGSSPNKYFAMCRLRDQLGVSESALVFRLVEIASLNAVLVRYFFSDVPMRISKGKRWSSSSPNQIISNLSCLFPTEKLQLENADFSISGYGNHEIEVQGSDGSLTLSCTGWVREFRNDGHEYWVVGWDTNSKIETS
jgi:Zn-dependent peptidase ImmA (M78 family)